MSENSKNLDFGESSRHGTERVKGVKNDKLKPVFGQFWRGIEKSYRKDL